MIYLVPDSMGISDTLAELAIWEGVIFDTGEGGFTIGFQNALKNAIFDCPMLGFQEILRIIFGLILAPFSGDFCYRERPY
jgi:hypothetical protein